MIKRIVLKFIVLSLFIGIAGLGILTMDRTLAQFNDVETSDNNNYSSAVLDFALSSAADFSPEVTPDQTASRTINVINEGELDFQYTVKVENPSGDLCDYLSVNDNFGTEASLIGFESAQAIFSAKSEWNFTASLTDDEVSLEGQTCNFKFVYKGNQLGECYGFSDSEEISATITAGEWNVVELLINKVYYDVDSSHGVEPKNEWIELYNPTNEAINLKDWQICNHDSCETINANKSIPALGYAVISHDASTWKYWEIPASVVKINALGGILFEMDNDADMLLLKNPEGIIVDQMNWGSPNSCTVAGIGWVKMFSEFTSAWESVQQVADGGYIVGSKYSFKLDSDGNQTWIKDFTVAGCEDIIINHTQETADGGYIVSASCSVSGDISPIIFKTDSNSNPLWAKTFAVSGYSALKTTLGSAEQTSDGGYVMAGYAYEGYHDYTAFIIKTDSAGDQVWAYKEAASDIKATIAQETADGGYIMAGTRPFSSMSPDETTEFFLVKFTGAGSQVWAKAYGGHPHLKLGSVQLTADGGYVVVGNYSAGSAGYNALIVKINSDGAIVQGKEYKTPGAAYDLFSFARQTADGGYIIVGKYLSMSGGHMYSGLLVKTDSAFNLIWAKKYETSGATQDLLEFVEQTADGGYVITGATKTGSYKALLIKTDSAGEISDCPSIQNLTTLTASNTNFNVRSVAVLTDPSIIVPFATPTAFTPGLTLSPTFLCGGGAIPSCSSWPNSNSGIWDPGAVDVAEGNMLGRNPTGYDTDQPSDWKEFGPPTVTITNYLGSIWYCNSTYPVNWKVINPNGAANELKVDMVYIIDNGTTKGSIDENDTNFLVAENLPFNTGLNSGMQMLKVDNSLGYCYYGYAWVKLIVSGSENPMLNSVYNSPRIFEPTLPAEGMPGISWIDILAAMDAEVGPEIYKNEEESADEEDSDSSEDEDGEPEEEIQPEDSGDEEVIEPIIEEEIQSETDQSLVEIQEEEAIIEEEAQPEEEIIEPIIEEEIIEELAEETEGVVFQILPLNDDINLPEAEASGADSPEEDGVNN
ncbi:MAG: lamin tail domain-containing protein [bacterium]